MTIRLENFFFCGILRMGSDSTSRGEARDISDWRLPEVLYPYDYSLLPRRRNDRVRFWLRLAAPLRRNAGAMLKKCNITQALRLTGDLGFRGSPVHTENETLLLQMCRGFHTPTHRR